MRIVALALFLLACGGVAPEIPVYETPDDDPVFGVEEFPPGVAIVPGPDGGTACICHRHMRGKGHHTEHHCTHGLTVR